MIRLDIDPKIFNEKYLRYGFKNNHRYQIYFGGSSSGKSYAMLGQRTVLDILGGNRNYLIVRNTLSTIRGSSFNEIVKAIHFFKVRDYFNINKTELTITCTLNDMQIRFAGLDDVEKIKSVTPIKGVITDIIIEEATETEYKAYKQLDKRLRGESKVPKRMTFLFNPVLKDHWLYTEFFNIWDDSKFYVENDKISILKTIYKDNKFLSEDDVEALESETDQYYYNVYTLGNWGVLGAVIFKNWRVEDLSDMIPSFDNNHNGGDWGFADDPFALSRFHYDQKKKKIYIYDELYLTGMLNGDIAPLVIDIIGNEYIIMDSSEPKSIEEFRRNYKIRAKGAKKGKGSIESGIKFLQDHEIIIHTTCQNTKNEFSKYKYKEDKNGKVMPIPVDKDNHLIDAIRYACEGLNRKEWGWKKGE